MHQNTIVDGIETTKAESNSNHASSEISLRDTLQEAWRGIQAIGAGVVAFNSWLNQIGPIIAQGLERFEMGMRTIGEALIALDAWLKEQHVIYERFGPLMLALGWPPPAHFSQEAKMYIIDYYDAHGEFATSKMLETYMVQYYGYEMLQAMCETWLTKRWLLRRSPILTAVVQAHIEGNYWLSIPSLLPQIEGIMAEGFAHQGQLNGKDIRNYLGTLLAPGLLKQYPEQIEEFVRDYLLVTFKHGAPIGSDVSRHAILHGADTNYGTETNSLKLVLLFDYLQDAFRLVSTPKGRCYHLIGCSRMGVPTRSQKLFFSTIEAKAAGLRPCRSCVEDQDVDLSYLVGR